MAAAKATAVQAAILRTRGMTVIIAYLQIARDCVRAPLMSIEHHNLLQFRRADQERERNFVRCRHSI
jgi:hypothetical protein